MTSNRNTFKSTPIPHRSKFSEPMMYYVLSEDGKQHIKVSRAMCLAHAAESDNPYPQRWFVDEESGLVVRLPRNQMGEELARDNMRSIWREDKQQERRCSCIAECSPRCPITCINCPMRDNCDSLHKETNGLKCVKKCEPCTFSQSRMVELDITFDNDCDDSTARFEPADSFDMEDFMEEQAKFEILTAALADLAQEDSDLIKAIFWGGKTERQLAPELGLKEPKSVNKRKHRILEILRGNEALHSFFE